MTNYFVSSMYFFQMLKIKIAGFVLLAVFAGVHGQAVSDEFATVELSSYAVIHRQAENLAKSLSTNFSSLNSRAQDLAVGRLEDYLARKEAIKVWSKFDMSGMPYNNKDVGGVSDGASKSPEEASSGRRLLQTSGLPNGIYRINYQGPGPCRGRVLGYVRNSKDSPGRASLGAATASNPVLWQVTNMAGNTREITLTAINRASCCRARLRYSSPRGCNSDTVNLANDGGLRWRFVSVKPGLFRLNAAKRTDNCPSSALGRLGPAATTGRRCDFPYNTIRLHRVNFASQDMIWKFTRISPPPPPPSPPPSPPPPRSPPQIPTPSPPLSPEQYREVLGLSWRYYLAQRAGYIPAGYPLSWITTSLESDPVQPGWYDAGDTLKQNFPLSGTVSFLAWGLVDCKDAYSSTGNLGSARDTLRSAVDYLANSLTAPNTYVGMIGEPDIDHQFWGRPSQYPLERFPRYPFIYSSATATQADLLGSVAAALASASMVYRDIDSGYADSLRNKAAEIWQWGTVSEGLYSKVYPQAARAYPSTDWADDMAWGAAWLFRATGDANYLNAAHNYWTRGDQNPYPCWDSKWAPVAAMLVSLQDSNQAVVPFVDTYRSWLNRIFLRAWLQPDGFWSIVRTPLGMVYPSWSKWGNLRYATTAGMVAAMHARHNPDPVQKAAELTFARSQLDYSFATTGRSFVVGHGSVFPLQPHHAAASCPNMPAPCGWEQYSINAPNPQVINGALVGGPEGEKLNFANPDDSYTDSRSNYAANEPATDYNAGLATSLAAVISQLR